MQARIDDFVVQVEKFIWKGGRFVRTIHNTVSHDRAFADLEVALSTRLAAIAHVLHFHAAASVDEVDAVFPIPRDKVVIARHGHYIGTYPDFVTREAAREALGLAPAEDVIVFTGQIRAYKGIDALIEAFRRILADRPQARLILAGAPESDPLAGHDLSEVEQARIQVAGRFVEDGELQVFLRAADIAAYPYAKILTSGSLILALSYGVPCVVPDVAMTSEVLEGSDAGVIFDPASGTGALEQALRRLLSAKDQGLLDEAALHARNTAEKLAWQGFDGVTRCSVPASGGSGRG